MVQVSTDTAAAGREREIAYGRVRCNLTRSGLRMFLCRYLWGDGEIHLVTS